jgi:hypothetical protein
LANSIRHVINVVDSMGNDRVMVVKILDKTANNLFVECQGQHHVFKIADILQMVAIDGPDLGDLLEI